MRVAFPSITDPHASAVAFDWMGRQIVCARTKKRFGWTEPRLLLADVDFAQLDDIGHPDTLARVLASDQYRHAFEEPEFESWREATGTAALTFNQCVEYVIPPFLGGPQTPENLTLVDTSVHWVLVSQLVAQTRGLAPGTPVGPFRVRPDCPSPHLAPSWTCTGSRAGAGHCPWGPLVRVPWTTRASALS